MGCVTHVSTSSELQIASNLSKARAKIFLETRYYMRDALSALFNINPIKIPITAQPVNLQNYQKDIFKKKI